MRKTDCGRHHLSSLVALAFAVFFDGLAIAQPAKTEAFDMSQAPMVFYLAKGEPNACGPGCNEWIAAEGIFDGDAHKRLSELLQNLKGRKPPIYFHSIGGQLGMARMVGRVLHAHGMTASVGQTIPEECKRRDAACRDIIASNRELKARLLVIGAFCHSACVYALVGAPVREVPIGARVGIHSSRPSPESIALSRQPGAPTPEQLHAARKKYVSEMDSNPAWVDLATTVSSDQLHILTREEIERFRIEKHAKGRSR